MPVRHVLSSWGLLQTKWILLSNFCFFYLVCCRALYVELWSDPHPPVGEQVGEVVAGQSPGAVRCPAVFLDPEAREEAGGALQLNGMRA